MFVLPQGTRWQSHWTGVRWSVTRPTRRANEHDVVAVFLRLKQVRGNARAVHDAWWRPVTVTRGDDHVRRFSRQLSCVLSFEAPVSRETSRFICYLNDEFRSLPRAQISSWHGLPPTLRVPFLLAVCISSIFTRVSCSMGVPCVDDLLSCVVPRACIRTSSCTVAHQRQSCCPSAAGLLTPSPDARVPESCLESGVPLRALSPFLGDRGGEAIELRRPGFLANPSCCCGDCTASPLHRNCTCGVRGRGGLRAKGSRTSSTATTAEQLRAFRVITATTSIAITITITENNTVTINILFFSYISVVFTTTVLLLLL